MNVEENKENPHWYVPVLFEQNGWIMKMEEYRENPCMCIMLYEQSF